MNKVILILILLSFSGCMSIKTSGTRKIENDYYYKLGKLSCQNDYIYKDLDCLFNKVNMSFMKSQLEICEDNNESLGKDFNEMRELAEKAAKKVNKK